MSLTQKVRVAKPSRMRRAFLTFVTALAMLLLSVTVAFAGAPAPTSVIPMPEPRNPVPQDKLCIAGMVINHAEEPLAGWTVTATYQGVNGSYAAISATTDAQGRFTINVPGPGRWGIEVESRERWEGVTTTALAVHVGFGNAGCVQVRFKVRELVVVKVIKIDEEHIPQPGWKITATPVLPGNPFGVEQSKITDENGEVTFELTPGPWRFTESPPADVMWWRPISPADGVHRLVVVGPGPHTLRFKNMLEKKPKGCINVFKYDVPPDPADPSFGLAGWPIEIQRANGSVAAAGVTDSFGQITFTGLPYGPYTVREFMQPGWEPASPTSYSVFLTSRDDGCTDIIFYNKQVPKGFCFEGRKVDLVGGYGIPDWEIRFRPLEPGGFVPDPVLTDGEGRYRVYLPMEDYRIPGAVYEISEVIPTGWTPVSPASYQIALPMNPDICVQVPNFVNRQTRFGDGGGKDGIGTVGLPGPHPGVCRATHIVASGDSVYKIAARYGVPAQQVFRANPWIMKQRSYWLYVGQKVCVP